VRAVNRGFAAVRAVGMIVRLKWRLILGTRAM
jgi:hypothetical protein